MNRNVLFAAASLLLSALMILAMEGALRLVGLGSPPELHESRLGYQQIALPVLVPDQRPDGTAILRTRDPRLPYQSILREKPPNSLRIFTFGGSATAGLGFSPNVTFARHLERMLREAPSTKEVEVVNLGVVALSSSQVREIVRDVIDHYEPDLLIVYSGNNEFLEMHAQKYADRHASFSEKAYGVLSRTNFFRLLNSVVSRPRQQQELSNRDLAASNLRLTQDEIIQDIKLSSDELDEVVDLYEQNLDVIASIAQARSTPLLMMTVAANWEWRGRKDLSADDWLELVGEGDIASSEVRERALKILDERIQDEEAPDRYEMLFRRATLLRENGDIEAARADYRASMNADPHLRRALDRMNERVRRVAEGHDTHFVDSVDVLSQHAEHGIVGFDEFYDYVHFTPKGALVIAGELYRRLEALGMVAAEGGDFRPYVYVRDELARTARMVQDDFDVNTWLGIGFDPGNISDRNLWKYDEMVASLDELLEREPDNEAAFIYRGNAHYHKIDGASAAAIDYRAVLELNAGNAAARANLDQLLGDRSADARPEVR